MVLTTLVDGRRETRELADGSYIIGRSESCRLRFPFSDVSERHAILTVHGGEVSLEDLHSSNGTFVNGEPIDGRVILSGSMIVQIGQCMLRVSDEVDQGVADASADGANASCPVGENGLDGDASGEDALVGLEEAEQPQADPMRELRRSVQEQIQRELLKRMDMKRLTVQGVDREGLEERAQEKIHQIIDEVVANGRLPAGIDPVRLEDDVFNEAMRLGPLEDLLEDTCRRAARPA